MKIAVEKIQCPVKKIQGKRKLFSVLCIFCFSSSASIPDIRIG